MMFARPEQPVRSPLPSTRTAPFPYETGLRGAIERLPPRGASLAGGYVGRVLDRQRSVSPGGEADPELETYLSSVDDALSDVARQLEEAEIEHERNFDAGHVDPGLAARLEELERTETMLLRLRRSSEVGSSAPAEALYSIHRRTPAAPDGEAKPSALGALGDLDDRLFQETLVGNLSARAGERGANLAGTAGVVLSRSMSRRAGYGGLVETHPTPQSRAWHESRGAEPSPYDADNVVFRAGRPVTVPPRSRG